MGDSMKSGPGIYWLRSVLLLVMSGVIALSTRTATAQIAPYAMFSAGHYSGLGVGPGVGSNESGGITALGGTFGVYDDFVKMGPCLLYTAPSPRD